MIAVRKVALLAKITKLQTKQTVWFTDVWKDRNDAA